MAILELSFASGEDSLSVRRFSVQEAVSSLFTVSVSARSESATVDLESLVGQPASLRIQSGVKFMRQGGARYWTGICSFIEQVHGMEPNAGQRSLSTYQMRIVPSLWLLGQRRNNRIFQHKSIPDITDALLGEWGLEHTWSIDRGKYPKLGYRAQYGESDLAFLTRLWEEAGVAYTFPDDDEKGSQLTLSDKLHQNTPRPGGGLHYVDNPNQSAEMEFVTRVRLAYEVRPGATTLRDYDFRNPGFQLLGESGRRPRPRIATSSSTTSPAGSSSRRARAGTPIADDQGATRHDQPFGKEARRGRWRPSAPGAAPSPSRPTPSTSGPASSSASTTTRTPSSARGRASSSPASPSKARRARRGRCRGRPSSPTRPTARQSSRPSPRSSASRAPPSSAPRARRSTPTSSGACACSSPGIARARATSRARAGSA